MSFKLYELKNFVRTELKNLLKEATYSTVPGKRMPKKTGVTEPERPVAKRNNQGLDQKQTDKFDFTRSEKTRKIFRRNLDRHSRAIKFYGRLLNATMQQPLSPATRNEFSNIRRILSGLNTFEFLDQFDLATDQEILRMKVPFAAVEQGASSRLKQLIELAYTSSLHTLNNLLEKIQDLKENLSLTESQTEYLDRIEQQNQDPELQKVLKDLDNVARTLDSKKNTLKSSGPPESSEIIDQELDALKTQMSSFASAAQQHAQKQFQSLAENDRSLMKKIVEVNKKALKAKEEGRKKDYIKYGKMSEKLRSQIKETKVDRSDYPTLSVGAKPLQKSYESLDKLIKEFYPYAKSKLGFKENCTVILKKDAENSKNPLGKTAYYDPASKKITVYVSKRHPKDILRSFSHELVHHSQNERGEFDNVKEMGDGYAQNDKHLREMEREAYEKGNLIFRDWEDTRR